MEKSLEPVLKLLEALSEDRTLEKQEHGEWVKIANPDMPDVLKHPSKYRIDPIVIKPFETQKECLDEIVRHHPAGWLKEKDTSNIYSIQAVFADSLHIKDIVWDFQACSQFFIFLDGNAFGKIDNTNK